jgi:anti-sigma B factor antagonist
MSEEKTPWPWWRSRHGKAIEVAVEDRGGDRVVSVRGRLTIETSPELLEQLRKAVKRAPRLKVDLSGVEFLDSSGISVLIQGLKLAQERSIDYALLDPSPKVQAIIELSQLHEFFTVETTAGAG